MLTHDTTVSLRERGRGGTSGGEGGVTLRLCHRLLREEPAWIHRPVQELSERDCRRMFSRVVPATRTHMRAAVALDRLFSRALGRGRGVIGTVFQEGEPDARTPLSPVQCRRLLTTALREEHLPCAPALGLMLWGGVSPEEIERLRWRHIDWEHRELLVPGSREEEAAAGGAGESGSKAVRGGVARDGGSLGGVLREGDVRGGDTRGGDTRGGDTQSGDTRAEAARDEFTWDGDTRDGDTRDGGTRDGDARDESSRGGGTCGGGARRGDARGGEDVVRRVPLRPILCRRLLRTSLFRDPESPVVPRSWQRRWELLWTSAGFRRKSPEALLYTYAACHARLYRDIPGLMRELGAAGSRLFPPGEASVPVVPEAWARSFWERPMPGDANLFN